MCRQFNATLSMREGEKMMCFMYRMSSPLSRAERWILQLHRLHRASLFLFIQFQQLALNAVRFPSPETVLIHCFSRGQFIFYCSWHLLYSVPPYSSHPPLYCDNQCLFLISQGAQNQEQSFKLSTNNSSVPAAESAFWVGTWQLGLQTRTKTRLRFE